MLQPFSTSDSSGSSGSNGDSLVKITLDGLKHEQSIHPGGFISVNANDDNGSKVKNLFPETRDFTLTKLTTFSDPTLIEITLEVWPKKVARSTAR